MSRSDFLRALLALFGGGWIASKRESNGVAVAPLPHVPQPSAPDVTPTSTANAGETYHWNVQGNNGYAVRRWFRATPRGTEWLNPQTNKWESLNG